MGPVLILLVGAFFLFVAFTSGVMPWAILFGAITSVGWFAISREWKPALGAGSGVAGAIMVIGILNVLTPGWFTTLQQMLTLS